MAARVGEPVVNLLRVQVVDDHSLTAMGLAAVLQDKGFAFADHVDRVEDVSLDVDVVVCDLVLRGRERSGFSAIKYLRSAGLPVVATSGYATATSIASAIAGGAYAFVSKDGASSSAEAWTMALAAATERAPSLNAQLAAAILADARRRPLRPDEDLSDDLRSFLRQILREADSPLKAGERDWRSPNIRTTTERIWLVTQLRHASYQLDIDARLRTVAEFLRQGKTAKEAAGSLAISPRYVDNLVQAMKAKFKDDHAGSGSSLLELDPQDLLLSLLEMEEEYEYGLEDAPTKAPPDR